MRRGCSRTPGAIELGQDFASNLTQKRQDNAVRCGYKGIINRYPGCQRVSEVQPKIPAVSESTALTNRMNAFAKCDTFTIGTTALTSSQHTRKLEDALKACTPENRFAQYARYFPPACPVVNQPNSTEPQISLNKCEPSRFF
jgi:hypothetical protein